MKNKNFLMLFLFVAVIGVVVSQFIVVSASATELKDDLGRNLSSNYTYTVAVKSTTGYSDVAWANPRIESRWIDLTKYTNEVGSFTFKDIGNGFNVGNKLAIKNSDGNYVSYEEPGLFMPNGALGTLSSSLYGESVFSFYSTDKKNTYTIFHKSSNNFIGADYSDMSMVTNKKSGTNNIEFQFIRN